MSKYMYWDNGISCYLVRLYQDNGLFAMVQVVSVITKTPYSYKVGDKFRARITDLRGYTKS